jgi:hypothetical protein
MTTKLFTASNTFVLKNIRSVMNGPIYQKCLALANGHGGIDAALDYVEGLVGPRGRAFIAEDHGCDADEIRRLFLANRK